MKTKVLVPILSVFAIAIVYILIAYKPGIKPVVYNQSFPQVTVQTEQPTSRLISGDHNDYSYNLTVGNKLHLTPITNVGVGYLAADIGDIWHDAKNGEIRYKDGNSLEGTYFAMGRYGVDTLGFEAKTSDSASFPQLQALGWDISFTIDTLSGFNGTTSTINFKHGQTSTSLATYDSSVLPYTINHSSSIPTFVTYWTYQNCKVVWAKGDATNGRIRITRKVRLF